ncbi:N-acyl-D-amino-acid deacylase family protein [Nocardiopsis changdeensis]|uniref:D-aminoacylase n=1 Tax=Nocardiopsis changdeensis TaxID=2831969 RepID=A0ABX8BJP4_9ACTN|nr:MULTISPECIES: D-aminoacylase [Nocardiopsis]QUX21156.1 D-aminoacylase [Nocardiopsis changdeensis]QYX37086.1 D-aminoacylase [Nocardiopsis sp. MT53]
MHDIVITGGTVVDGTGAPGRRADVAVDGDRITAVGTGPLRGRRTIDATDRIVSPGFVDLHSHADFTLPASPGAVTQLAQGVTTLVTGNCGHSPFPLTERNRDAGGFAGFDPAALDWSWTDAEGYAAMLDARRPGVNVGLQIGHNMIRSAVLGGEDRAPGDAELEEMRGHVSRAAEQGVLGFSTGLIYPPGLFAATDEVVALVRRAAEHGMLYSTHVRNETDRVLEAVAEALETARSAGARLQVSHLKSMGPGNHGLALKALDLILRERERGLDVTCDVYPYTASSTSLASRLPAWALDGGAAAVAARLADTAERARIVEGLHERFGRDIDPAGIVLAEPGPGPFADRAGWSVTEIAAERGMDPAEVVLAVLAGHGDVAIVNHAMSEDDVRGVLASPISAVASDGWVLDASGPGRPHPRSFGTFARVLGRYVRDEGVLGLEEAVRRMTSLPAARAGLADRGVLAPGSAADVAVFDPERVADRSTYEDPWRLSVGTEAVLVNGVPAVEGGEATGERPGRVLRRAA